MADRTTLSAYDALSDDDKNAVDAFLSRDLVERLNRVKNQPEAASGLDIAIHITYGAIDKPPQKLTPFSYMAEEYIIGERERIASDNIALSGAQFYYRGNYAVSKEQHGTARYINDQLIGVGGIEYPSPLPSRKGAELKRAR